MTAHADHINDREAAFIGIKALAYISQLPDELLKFLNVTGITPPDVLRLKENLSFLGGVLDFLTRDESLFLAFCADEDFSADQVESARLRLNGTPE